MAQAKIANRLDDAAQSPVLSETASAPRSLYFLIVLFLLFASGITIIGYIYYKNYEKQYRAEVDAQISAIADLKVTELARWRKERMGDAEVLFRNESFTDRARAYLDNPADTEAKTPLLAWLSRFHESYNYDRVFLLDPQGVERISVPASTEAVPSYIKDNLSEILQSGKITFMDFQRNAPDQPIHLALLTPILDTQNGDNPIGLLVLQIDPDKYLYPFVSRWLTPSESAETLIARRDGNDALFLNNLRFDKNAALTHRIPLENKDVLVVKSILGQEGTVEGTDYRGEPVIGYVHAVPDSPWFLVARIDKSEVYAPLRARLWELMVLLGAIILGAGAGLAFIWRRRSTQYYREKLEVSEALRLSEARYGTTLMSVGDGVIATDAEGRVELLNPVAEKLTGYTQQEARSKQLEDVFSIVNEETRQLVENPVRRVVRDGLVVGLANHTLLVHRDGAEHPIADSGAPIRNEKGEITGVVLVFRDQTQERATQKALLDSEASLAEAQRIAHIGNWDWNIVTNGLHWSDEIYRIFGLTPQEFGATYDAFLNSVHPEDRKHVTNSVDDALAKRNLYSIDHRIMMPTGEVHFVHETGEVTFDTAGKAIRMIGTVQDITERKRIEEAKERVEQELEKQRALSIQSDRLRALGEMATGIAHELNQPLLGVRGLSEHVVIGMNKGWYPEQNDIKDKCQLVIEQVDRMSHIIEHVRGFARGASSDDLVPTQVNEVVRAGLGLMEAQLKSRGLILQTKLADQLPMVMANPFSLEEVIFNLVSNGRDAMLEKIEREQMRNPVISISTGIEENDGAKKVIIKVEDQGAGIPPEVMEKIFDPFFTTKEPGKGTGVGLPIVKSIVESVGGEITIKSKPKVGTTALVRLPAMI